MADLPWNKHYFLFNFNSSDYILQARNQIVTTESERYLLVYVLVVLVVIISIFVLFFVVFQRRKNQLLLDKINQQKQFDEELLKTQQEIQEETLNYIGRELHDNVGQMLVLATMQMNAVAKVAQDDIKAKVNNASGALKDTLVEVRALSKSLNSDVIFNLEFDVIVKNEIERLNKTGLIEAKITVDGNKVNFENKKDKIILFRILQEFFSNTLKYAKAENLDVTLNYLNNQLKISVEDDGNGFNMNSVEKGSGLINMQKRAELINAVFNLDSKESKGTRLSINYPYRAF
jgi:signal transduction histidine kinase